MMTQAEMQIAIAEKCGWRYGPFDMEHRYSPGENTGGVGWIEQDGIHRNTAPGDYPNDLNAMHEAEMALSDEDYPKFHYYLVKSRNDECMPRCRCPSATAAQRAEAFCRVFWPERFQ